MKKQVAKKSEKRTDIKVVSFILFTIAFFGIFAIRPAISLIFTLQKEKSEYEQIDRTLEQKIQKIISTQSQFMTLISNKSVVEDALPSTHRIEKTKEVLEQKLIVETFTIQQLKIHPYEKPGLNSISFNLGAVTNYDDFVDFLDYLQNSRRLLTPQTISIDPSKGSSESAQLNFTTTLKTYFYISENAN